MKLEKFTKWMKQNQNEYIKCLENKKNQDVEISKTNHLQERRQWQSLERKGNNLKLKHN